MSPAARLPLAVGFTLLFAWGAAGDDPKPVDLSDLKGAVKAATKKGANVDEVSKAVDALEKLVTKDRTGPKSGDPPQELAALREAVELAARKGEDVAEIRTELEAVEKAVLGRVLKKPGQNADKPEAKPDPNLPPVPYPRGKDVLVIRHDGVIMVIDSGGPKGDLLTLTTENGAFHFTAKRGGVEYYATGLIGKNGPEEVLGRITDGDTKHDFDEPDKVPEKYRPTLDKLLNSIRYP